MTIIVCSKTNGRKQETSSFIQQLSPMEVLYADLFKDYNKGLRPVANLSKTVDVNIHFWFKQIIKVNKVDQIMTIYCWLEITWKDEFLSWNPKKYNNIDEFTVPVDNIWKPDILVYNGAKMNIAGSELETNVILNSDGKVILFKALIEDISCQFDMTYFPFDQQVCYIMFASWSYDGSKIQLKLESAKTYLDFYIKNTEWDLLDFKVRKNNRIYECCPEPFPEILYYFVIERNPTYYIISLILPSIIITVIMIVGFFTPYSSTGENTEKVSLGVTALLSLGMIVLMVSDNMSATSLILPLIGKFYVGLISIIFTAACASTVIVSIQMKGNEPNEICDRYKKILTLMAKVLLVRVNVFEKDINYKESFEDPDVEHFELIEISHLFDTTSKGIICDLKMASKITGEPSNATHDFRRVFVLLAKINVNVCRMRNFVKQTKRQFMICQQWSFAARVLERLFMIIYISFTLIFAITILNSRREPIELTDECMNRLINA